jgi:photosystem II oxygen-evolving enhancer protein 2
VACSVGVSGLQSYVNTANGYQFLYPNGWIQVDVENATEGVDVVFRDLIERSENLSVIISNVNKDEKLEDLGTPTDVGYRFMKMVNNNPDSERDAQLVNAELRENNAKKYYILEYKVDLPFNQHRHNLASVGINKGKLFTFNLSLPENRWQKRKELSYIVVKSFSIS